jgi:indole-3-glycerol phosphate synthase
MDKTMTILDRIVADKIEEVDAAARKTPEADLRARIADMSWSARGFAQRLSRPGPAKVNIIAEVKRASPSKGDICPDLDAVHCARQYAAGGAAAISVLTDTPYFKGSLEDMRKVRAAVTLPVLRKEFIVRDYQMYESRAAGADAVLLIARILTAHQLQSLMDLCGALGMDALVEIHTPEDYAVARAAGSRLIGINNRNLATFDTDIGTAMQLSALLGPGEIPVAASGISARSDIERNLQQGIFNFLVGESLVRAQDRVAFLRTLIHGPRTGEA